jgi:hypothetical protein
LKGVQNILPADAMLERCFVKLDNDLLIHVLILPQKWRRSNLTVPGNARVTDTFPRHYRRICVCRHINMPWVRHGKKEENLCTK